jgi:hypothetical protein
MNTNPDTDPEFDDQKLEKNIQYKILWVIFALLDPDSEFGFTNLIESGSETLLLHCDK